jgi:UDP-glucose 6-dehydrogenase
MNPDRVVVGAEDPASASRLAALYAPFADEIVTTDVASAELIKLASNAFLATKISFINEIANVCEEVDADVSEVARGMGLDSRIGGSFLRPGIGYGGSCLHGDETVLVRRDGRISLRSLEDLFGELGGDADGVVEPEGLEVLSWHPEAGEPLFLPVAAASRRRHAGELVALETSWGRRLRCSPDHPLVVGDGAGGRELRQAGALRTTDWLPLAGQRSSPAAVPSDEWSWRIVGLALADGPVCTSAASRGVTWKWDGEGHDHLAAEVAAWWSTHGVSVTTTRGPASTSVSVAPDAAPQRLLDAAAPDAGIPDELWDEPHLHREALLSGLFDGHGRWAVTGDRPSWVNELETTSPRLADGVLRLLGDAGLHGSVDHGPAGTIRVRVSNAKDGYRSAGPGTSWVRVVASDREPYDGPVYSLEVPGAETFVTTGGLVVHNCFPKDVAALKQLAGNSGYHFQLLASVIEVNELQKRRVIGKLKRHLGELRGRRIALWGLAFKPDTNDMREASSIVLAHRLTASGARVTAFDPVVTQAQVARDLPEVEIAAGPLEAADGADAVVIVTEWPEFRSPVLDGTLKARMAFPLVVDGRNMLDPQAVRAAGYVYEGVGRRASARSDRVGDVVS